MASEAADPRVAPAAGLAAHLPRLAGRVTTEADDGVLRVAGSLLCADLTGFTRLTERFAERGRAGAEGVSAVLDATFSTVLGPALDAGGDVLCFGGDAATVAFTGAGHEDRAVEAAVAMQAALASAPRPAAAERVALRMTVGVAAGELEAALVGGEDQQALVVVGPTVRRAIRLEHDGRPGQVLVADGPDGHRVARGRRGARPPTAPAEARTERDGDGPPPPPALVPPALRELLGGQEGPGPGELRRTTTAFVLAGGDLGTVRSVAATLDATCRRWGVCWLATDVGDGTVTFVVTAGAPVATEHDEERLVGAIGSILEAAPTGSVQVGLERGVVFAGDVGHPARRAWTVIGDSVNVAARLAAAARPGQALAGPALRAAIPHVFDDLPPTHLVVKGKRKALAATGFDRARRLRPPNGGGAAARTSGPLVGRDEELARLAEAWEAARAGRGRAVELVGEAGIGKSRLLVALRDLAGPGAASVVVPEHYRMATPFATASKLLRSVAGIPESLGPEAAGAALAGWVEATAPQLSEWLPLVADAADARVPSTPEVERLDPEFVPERRRDVVVALLSAARTEPWLVVVDDLHLVDEASRELLSDLARWTIGRPWLVCTAVRSSGDGRGGHRGRVGIAASSGAEVLEVGPLGKDAATELVLAAAEPVAIADPVLARILEAADGNPLFLRQLARHSIGVDPEVPDTVERVLAARIDELATADRQLLRDVSVLGRAGPLDRAAVWLARPELADPARWEPLRDLVSVGAGTDGTPTFRFRSDLTRSIAYEGLSVRRRRALHAEVARQLTADLPADGVAAADDETVGLLAAHLLEAGEPTAAWPVAVEAARRARRRVALVDALTLYRRALRSSHRLPHLDPRERAAVLEEQGEVALDLARFDLALDAFAAAARATDDPVDRARLCSRRAAVQQQRGALSQASAWATRGLHLLEASTDPRAGAVRAQLLLDQAATRHFQGRNLESVEWAERAAAEAEHTEDDRLLALAHLHLEMAHSMLGDGQAAAHGEKAISLFATAGDRRGLADALINSGLTAYAEGRWAEARTRYEQATQVAASTGNVTKVAVARMNTAFLLAEVGDFVEAADRCAAAARAFRATGNDLTLGYIDYLRARLALWEGDAGRSATQLAEARRRFEETGARQMVLDCDVAAIEVRLVAGDVPGAVAEADRLVAEIDAFGPAELLPITVRRLRARALVLAGDPEAALTSAHAAVALARDRGARMELALALDAVAHAERARGREPDPAVTEERDRLLSALGVKGTILPLA